MSLTMSSIAKELGCTAPALQGRFGSKAELLQEFFRWGNRDSADRFRRARQLHDSPIEALLQRFQLSAEAGPDREYEIDDLADQLNIIFFHRAAWLDPSLKALERERRRIYEEGITTLLNEAVSVGELADCDPKRLGRLIMTVVTGAQIQWETDPQPANNDFFVGMIEDLIRPYRIESDKALDQVSHADGASPVSEAVIRGITAANEAD